MAPKEEKASTKNGKMDFQNIVSRIENMILTGAFKPRERLIEATLSEMFEVSRYSVRDAFKVLETKGLVRVTPFKGVVVSELSKQEVEEIFVVRTALEQLALKLSMDHATAEDLRVLRRMCKRIEDACHEDDFAAMISTDTDFHNYLFQMSQNNILCRMINDLKNRWPESAEPRPGFHEKDQVENYLHAEVCAGRFTLTEAQQKISTDWIVVYQELHR